MPNEVAYYLYIRIINDKDNKLNKNIVKDAVNIYGFKSVYNCGYISNLKLYSKIDRKLIENSNLLCERTIDFIYRKDIMKL